MRGNKAIKSKYSGGVPFWRVNAVEGTTSPGGSNTEVQYNDNGTFGGATNIVIGAGGNLSIDSDSLMLRVGADQDASFFYDGTHTYISGGADAGDITIKNSDGDILLVDNTVLSGTLGVSGNITAKGNAVLSGTLGVSGAITVNDNYTLPTAAPGTNDYVLVGQTDGTVAWAEQSGGGGGGTVTTSGSPVANDFARFSAASVIEGRSYTQTRSDLGLVIGTNVLAQQTIGIADDNLVETDSASIADDDYAKFTSNGLEGRSYTEVKSDLGLGTAAERAAEDTLTDGSNLPDGAAIKSYGDTNWANEIDISGTPSAGEYAKWTDADTLEGAALGSAATRNAEDTLTDGANLPDGAAVKAYGDSNWANEIDISGTPSAGQYAKWTDADTVEGATLGSAALRAAEDTLTDGSNLPDGAAVKAYGDSNWANEIDISGTPSAGQYAKWTDADTVEGATLGSAALRAAEDTLTDGSNLPDGAAIKAYGDSNWGGGTSPWTSGSGFLYPTVAGDDLVIGASAQTAATVKLDVIGTGTAKSNFDIMALTNKVNAADMDNTTTSILFHQYYYDASTPAIEDLGRIGFWANNDWTSTASTRDSTFYIATAKDGDINSGAGTGQFQVNELGDAKVQHSLEVGSLGAAGIGSTLTIGSPNANEPTLVMTNGADDATAPIIELYNNRANLAITGPTDNDGAGVIKFYADNDADAKTEAARVSAKMANVNDGDERGYLALSVAEYDGTITEGAILSGGSSNGLINTNFPTAGTFGVSGAITTEGSMTVSGAMTLVNGAITSTPGANYLWASGTALYWNTTELGAGGGGGGTVTSVAIAGTDGIDVDSGSPITSAGTITLGLSNIANSKLANSSVSYGGVSVSLGASDATPAFDLSDATAYPGDSSLVTVGTVTAGTWQGTAVANSYVASSSNWNTAYNDHITGVAYSTPTLTLTQKDAGTITASIPGGAATGTVDVSGTPVDDDYAKFTDADTVEGRSYSEVKTDLSLNNVENTALSTWAGTSNILTVGIINAGTWTGDAITNAYLANDSVSYGGVEVDLGASDATPAFDLADATNYEGTAVKSTGETGGSKFLREDGDGTCSWQSPGGGGTVTTSGSPVDDDFAKFTDATTIEGRSYSEVKSDLGLGTAAERAAEDTLTDGSNLPDGAAIKAYGDSNWSNAGTVTSVAIGGNDGIDVDSGSPITSAGTIQLGLSNIANSKLANSSVSYGGVSVSLGGSDSTPAFDLSDATAYTGDSSLVTVGTITSGVWNGTAIANANLANDSVSYGGVEVDLGASDATPAFDLSDATNYEGTAIKSTGEGGGSKFLREDGDGTCSWQTPAGGGGSPGGSDTQIQYNDGGSSFGGISGFVWDDTDLKIDSDSIKLAFGDGQDMSIWHNGTDNFISGNVGALNIINDETAAGDIKLINDDPGWDITFAVESNVPAIGYPDPSLRIRGGDATSTTPIVQTHVGVIMDQAQPSVSTAVTLTTGKPFVSVTSDATVGGFPFADQTTALTLPAWEEGLWFRIGYKALGAAPSPLGRAQITIEASGSELIVYTGGASAGSASSVMIAESTRSGPVFGICEAYAAEVFADASSSTKQEVWIIQTGDRTAIQT